MDDTVNLVAATDHEHDLKTLVTDILERARKNGADAAEVSASEDAGLSVAVRLGELETVEFNRDRGFGITVYFGKRKGSASTSDSTPAAVAATVQAACNIARFTEEDPCHGLADASLMARVFPNLDLDHPWTTSVATAEAMAQEAESAARGHDRRIKNSDGASVGTQRVCRVYGNSNGFLGSHIATRHSISCGVIADDGNGMERDYYYSIGRSIDDLADRRECRHRSCAPRGGAPRCATDQDGAVSGAVLCGNRRRSHRPSDRRAERRVVVSKGVVPNGLAWPQALAGRVLGGRAAAVAPRSRQRGIRRRRRGDVREGIHRSRLGGLVRARELLGAAAGHDDDGELRRRSQRVGRGSAAAVCRTGQRNQGRSARHRTDRTGREHRHRRLLARRRGILDFKRRDRASGRRDHDRGSTRRHVRRARGTRRRSRPSRQRRDRFVAHRRA